MAGCARFRHHIGFSLTTVVVRLVRLSLPINLLLLGFSRLLLAVRLFGCTIGSTGVVTAVALSLSPHCLLQATPLRSRQVLVAVDISDTRWRQMRVVTFPDAVKVIASASEILLILHHHQHQLWGLHGLRTLSTGEAWAGFDMQ